ncbi:hypothetical protein V8D89_013148 [Ganoderma adspersum]
MLRPRYHPDWKPSWAGTKKYYEDSGDGLVLSSPLDGSTVLLVMPYLMDYHGLRFGTIGEAVKCFRQFFECRSTQESLTVDSGRSYDFKRRVRRFTHTDLPVKYYYVDFGHSRRYAPDDDYPLGEILIGGDKTVPEFQGPDEPLGNLIRTGFLEGPIGSTDHQPSAFSF